MSEKLGPMQFGSSQGQVFLGRDIGHEQNYSDSIAYEIDQEMQRFITECYEKCKDLLVKHSKEVHLIAQTLLEEETLEMEQIKQLIETGSLGNKAASDNGNEGTPNESGEAIIDNIGDVRVRIQGKDDVVPETPAGDVPNEAPNLDKGDNTDPSDGGSKPTS